MLADNMYLVRRVRKLAFVEADTGLTHRMGPENHTMLRQLLLLTALLLVPPAPCAPAAEATDFKVFVKVAGLGPIYFARGGEHVVIRSAEELAAATAKPQHAKDAGFQKEAQAELAALFNVKAIDWDKQMVIAIDGGTYRLTYDFNFVSFQVQNDTLTVHWTMIQTGKDRMSSPKGVALVERFPGKVQVKQVSR